jgi:hypothetical protein
MGQALPVDTPSAAVHTRRVSGLPNRLNIPDARGSGAYLRVTRHPDQQKVVLSHWRDSVCVASTPVDISELPSLIGVLAEALGDAVVLSGPGSVSGPAKPSAFSKLRDRFRPTLAKVVDLHMKPVHRSKSEGTEAK